MGIMGILGMRRYSADTPIQEYIESEWLYLCERGNGAVSDEEVERDGERETCNGGGGGEWGCALCV